MTPFLIRTYHQLRAIPAFHKLVTLVGNHSSARLLRNHKKKLDLVSDAFCPAKWLQSTVHLELGEAHSCFLTPRHQVTKEEISQSVGAFNNTKKLVSSRQEMLKGNRPPECDHCWSKERTGVDSDRLYKTIEPWSFVDYQKLKNNVDTVNPSYLEISFSSECNLKCAYCDPHISSSIKKEIDTFGPYPTSEPFQEYREPLVSEEYISAFWSWWETLKHELKVLRITGGEPLLHKELFQLLDKIKIGRFDFELKITSNLMVSPSALEKFIITCKNLEESKAIKSFTLYTSVDTWGKHAEFLRWGLQLERYVQNIEKCLSLHPKMKFNFLVTYGALSPFKFNQLAEFVLDLRRRFPMSEIRLGVSPLIYPKFLSLEVLDNAHIDIIISNLDFMKKHALRSGYPQGFTHFEISRFEDILMPYLSGHGLGQHRSDFKIFIHEYERRKKIAFQDYFPDQVSLLS